ncbi:MAG: SpoVR family protein [Desulfobacterales bacterium]
MELIDQHTKKIMEGCKDRARAAGLCFEDETLEYIVTNRDLLELTPKVMIPTLYDYWVHDVEILKEKGRYELYPGNPYETVINTRPAISFYNDNNPDWLNVMIFYHVLAHIDFFQNNHFFRHTWDDDFAGQALSDKRFIAKLRSEKGRWVDYVIEFTRGIDNLVGYHGDLSRLNRPVQKDGSKRLDYYFDVFLQSVKNVKIHEYMKEIKRFNECIAMYGEFGEKMFFSNIVKKYPEFEAFFDRHIKENNNGNGDLIQFLIKNSDVLRKDDNRWMTSVMHVVRKTSLFFQPQIRTKIMNEGWASYWHETLFLKDDRINGHEVDFARINAGVTALPRVGLNPYALGMRLFQNIENMGNKGKYDWEFRKIEDVDIRKKYNQNTGKGKELIFKVRNDFGDFMFINTFVDQDFVSGNKLFVAGRRLNSAKMIWEYYVKSRKAKDYRQMLIDSLYHPPHIEVDENKCGDHALYLVHHFEEKPLVKDLIANTMMGIEYLWGGPVHLETSEVVSVPETRNNVMTSAFSPPQQKEIKEQKVKWERVVYTMENRKISKKVL